LTTAAAFVDHEGAPTCLKFADTRRKVNAKYRRRIEASIRAVGLIEPLVVYPVGDQYEILDGYLRYIILLELGVDTVPCLIGPQPDRCVVFVECGRADRGATGNPVVV